MLTHLTYVNLTCADHVSEMFDLLLSCPMCEDRQTKKVAIPPSDAFTSMYSGAPAASLAAPMSSLAGKNASQMTYGHVSIRALNQKSAQNPYPRDY